MDAKKIIHELMAELDAIDEAIVALERIAAGRGGAKQRGRPPKWLAAARKEMAEDGRAGTRKPRKASKAVGQRRAGPEGT